MSDSLSTDAAQPTWRQAAFRRLAPLRKLQIVLVGAALVCGPAYSQQQPPPTEQRTQDPDSILTRGLVVSATASTMVVRTTEGEHIVVVYDRDTIGPRPATVGSHVRVISRRDSEGVYVARSIIVDSQGSPADVPVDEPVPTDVRRLESQIARQASRFRLGLRAGVGLDPEVLAVGAHTKLGPFFQRDVWFRPNIELGFGEVTKFGALNMEAIYRLPVTERQSRYSVYVGAGPGLNFIDRNFEEAESGERDIDFSDFDFDASLNFLAGVEFRSGMFLELKSTAYSHPQTKIIIGYSF